ARGTFGEFPDGIADDRFVTTRVARTEAAVVTEPVVVRPPGRIRDVLRVRTRVYAGNALAPAPAHDAGRAARLAGLARTVAVDVRLVPALAVFAGVSAVAKVRAARAARTGAVAWSHDGSSRAVGGHVPRVPAARREHGE